MKSITAKGTHLSQLKQLAKVLAVTIDGCEDPKIEDLEGGAQDGDEIGDLLAERRADGKPGAVRTHRTGPPV